MQVLARVREVLSGVGLGAAVASGEGSIAGRPIEVTTGAVGARRYRLSARRIPWESNDDVRVLLMVGPE